MQNEENEEADLLLLHFRLFFEQKGTFSFFTQSIKLDSTQYSILGNQGF